MEEDYWKEGKKAEINFSIHTKLKKITGNEIFLYIVCSLAQVGMLGQFWNKLLHAWDLSEHNVNAKLHTVCLSVGEKDLKENNTKHN